MREINFRVWDNLKKIWTNYKILDDLIYYMDKNTGVWFNRHHEERNIEYYDSILEVG